MAIISEVKFPHTKNSSRLEMCEWCRSNIGSGFWSGNSDVSMQYAGDTILWTGVFDYSDIVFLFVNPEDALLFKMRWV